MSRELKALAVAMKAAVLNPKLTNDQAWELLQKMEQLHEKEGDRNLDSFLDTSDIKFLTMKVRRAFLEESWKDDPVQDHV
jgi:hypothetical protein